MGTTFKRGTNSKGTNLKKGNKITKTIKFKSVYYKFEKGTNLEKNGTCFENGINLWIMETNYNM